MTKQMSVIEKVIAERKRHNALIAMGKIPHDCADPLTDEGYKCSVLGEEYGEVCKAILEDSNLQEELIQVAAVAVAWAEALE